MLVGITIALNKFRFHSLINKRINLVLVTKYHFDFRLQFDINKKMHFLLFQTTLTGAQLEGGKGEISPVLLQKLQKSALVCGKKYPDCGHLLWSSIVVFI